MRHTPDEHDDFIRDFIPKVSRTFALAMGFLPGRLRHPVLTAYLLCRMADTIEDSPFLEPAEKKRRLLRLKELLSNASEGKKLGANDISPLHHAINTEQGHDHRLLAESAILFQILSALPKSQQRIIYRWTAEMAGGMAEFSHLSHVSGSEIAALKDVAEWDAYCFYVAGTVGQMLTELFIGHYGINEDVAKEMKRLGSSFGLGLQKVNVIKDVPDDRQRGVCFLPMDIMLKHALTPESLGDSKCAESIVAFVPELIDLVALHLDDAIVYTTLIPGRYKGVRMFLTVPVFLAMETLDRIRRNPVQAMTGPPVKITREDVAHIVSAARACSTSDERLKMHHQELRDRIPYGQK